MKIGDSYIRGLLDGTGRFIMVVWKNECCTFGFHIRYKFAVTLSSHMEYLGLKLKRRFDGALLQQDCTFDTSSRCTYTSLVFVHSRVVKKLIEFLDNRSTSCPYLRRQEVQAAAEYLTLISTYTHMSPPVAVKLLLTYSRSSRTRPCSAHTIQ